MANKRIENVILIEMGRVKIAPQYTDSMLFQIASCFNPTARGGGALWPPLP